MWRYFSYSSAYLPLHLPAVPGLLLGPVSPEVIPVAHQDAAAFGMAHRGRLHAGVVGFLEPDSVSRMAEGLASRFPAIVTDPGEGGGLAHGIHHLRIELVGRRFISKGLGGRRVCLRGPYSEAQQRASREQAGQQPQTPWTEGKHPTSNIQHRTSSGLRSIRAPEGFGRVSVHVATVRGNRKTDKPD